MRIDTNWLGEYLSPTLSLEQIIKAMEAAGIEVEDVDRPAEIDRRIVVAEVEKLLPHPHADKLKLATINDGTKSVCVVCGAGNIAEGQKVAYAPPGAILPDGTELSRKSIRGVNSAGMICSQAELNLGDDHSGILVLGKQFAVGRPLCEVLGKAGSVIEVKSAANRPDLVGLVGVAREIAAQTTSQLKFEEPRPLKFDKSGSLFSNLLKPQVPRYTLAKLSLKGPLPATPPWMTQKLLASSVRPINFLVDITNYCMLETGQPLHAFDGDKVAGKVVIRKAHKGERLTTLDNKPRQLSSSDIVIADSARVLALAGIMGGIKTAISDRTKTVLIEAATFEGASIRKTAITQGLRTEASGRFERNLPTQLAEIGLARALELISELAEIEIERIEDELNVWPWVQHVGVRAKRLSQLAGTEISRKQIVDSLNKLGFKAELFDIVKAAKRHLGKPFIWGAKFKTHGDSAFDCSYFSDYLFSLIGRDIGHTAYEQYQKGRPVTETELKSGDQLFRGGPWIKLKKSDRGGVSHNYLYLGGGKLIHAKSMERDQRGQWKSASKTGVVIEPLSVATKDPDYLGARRYIDDLDDYVAVTVPWWRADVKSEEDILEEVIKLLGYDKLPATLPKTLSDDIEYDITWSRRWSVRQLLANLGLFEVVTYPFVASRQLTSLGFEPRGYLRLSNPRSLEQSYLRQGLLPALLSVAQNNTRYAKELGMFEIGNIFMPGIKAGILEQLRLGILMQSPRPYQRLKNILDNLASLGTIELDLKAVKNYSYFHPTRQVDIFLDSQPLGQMGQLDAKLNYTLKLKNPVGYIELDLKKILESWQISHFKAFSRFPPATRDLTVVVDRRVSWAAVAGAVKELNLASRISFGGDYYGREIDTTKKAMTLKLEIGKTSGNITDEEADRSLTEILKLLKRNFGAQPRQ